jgi:hypothetical protein
MTRSLEFIISSFFIPARMEILRVDRFIRMLVLLGVGEAP